MHIFKYSPKKGTKAAEMECQIDEKTKEERSQQLIQLSKKNQEEYNKKYIGKQLEVLLEETQGGYIKGHTTNYILVCAETKMNMQNKIVKIKIQDLKEDKLIGTII